MLIVGIVILVIFVMIFVVGMDMKIVFVMIGSGVVLFVVLVIVEFYRFSCVILFLDFF